MWSPLVAKGLEGGGLYVKPFSCKSLLTHPSQYFYNTSTILLQKIFFLHFSTISWGKIYLSLSQSFWESLNKIIIIAGLVEQKCFVVFRWGNHYKSDMLQCFPNPIPTLPQTHNLTHENKLSQTDNKLWGVIIHHHTSSLLLRLLKSPRCLLLSY